MERTSDGEGVTVEANVPVVTLKSQIEMKKARANNKHGAEARCHIATALAAVTLGPFVSIRYRWHHPIRRRTQDGVPTIVLSEMQREHHADGGRIEGKDMI